MTYAKIITKDSAIPMMCCHNESFIFAETLGNKTFSVLLEAYIMLCIPLRCVVITVITGSDRPGGALGFTPPPPPPPDCFFFFFF